MRDPSAGLTTLVGRALRRRCTRCGRGSFFHGWAKVADSCSVCGFAFERESGYWVGAMIIATTVTFGLMLVVFVGGWVLFWPDVPWTGVLVGTMVVAFATPIVFYPWSKSLWSAIELSYHALEPPEVAAAHRRADAEQGG